MRTAFASSSTKPLPPPSSTSRPAIRPAIRPTLALAVLTSALALTACGGGGSDSASPSPAPGAPAGSNPASPSPLRGAYVGTLSGGTSTAFDMIVLGNGEYWGLYGRRSGSTLLVDGLLQGQASAAEGRLISTDLRDFGEMPALAGTMSGTYDSVARTLSGSAAFPGGSIRFSGGPGTAPFSLDATPSLASLVGSWTLSAIDGEGINLTVSANGAFSARSAFGCNFTGSFAPRTTENAFDLNLSFGPAPCLLPGQTARGIGAVTPLAGGRNQLIVAAVTPDRQAGTAAFGVR